MLSRQILQDSFTLDNYIQITKKESLAMKRIRKESQTGRRQRKGSTQLSIFSWLNQTHSSQKSLILTLDKYMLLKIFGYLRLSELVVTSQVCSYFLSCYRSLWNDKEFFCQLETDKFTSKQLGKLIQKSSRLDHIRQLKNIYSGKNIKFCRDKIKIKVGQGSTNTGGMLEIFSVTPKNIRSGSTFILDSHIAEIVNSSFRSLKIIELVKCSFVKQFVCISRCTELVKLCISFNDNFKNQDLGVICKRCQNLQILSFEECRRLDQNIFEHIQYVQSLQSFTLRHFRQSFMKLKKLSNNIYLTHLDIDWSLINDIEAFHIISLKTLSHLSIRNCSFLTNTFLDYLIMHLNETALMQVHLQNNAFQSQKIENLQILLKKN